MRRERGSPHRTGRRPRPGDISNCLANLKRAHPGSMITATAVWGKQTNGLGHTFIGRGQVHDRELAPSAMTYAACATRDFQRP